MSRAIDGQHLTKYYRHLLAVDDVSFSVQEGELFGLLGPNGAGKTTSIRMLTGLSTPSSGTATVAGLDIVSHPIEVKEHIGVVSDVADLYGEMTAWDNLIFVARLHGMPRGKRTQRAEELLHLFGLYGMRDRRTAALSTGLKKRLTIAAALIHEPEILFLDEPTTGLDVQSARLIRDLMRELHERGVTILLTTHYIEEADQLCQRIAILNQGKIVAIDTPENLKSLAQRGKVIRASFDDPADAIRIGLQKLDHVEEVIISGKRATLYVQDPSEILPALVDTARESQLKVLSLNTSQPTLEDAFVALTGLPPETMTVEERLE